MCWLHVSGSATPSPKLPQLEDDCFRPPSRLSVMFVEWQNPRDKRRRWPWNALMAWSYWLYMDLPLVYIREMAFQIDRWPRCVLKWWLVWEPEGPKMLNASQRKKEPSSEGASNLSNGVLVYWPKLFKLWNPLNYIKLIFDLSKPTENSHGFEGSTFAFGVIHWFWGLGHWKHPDV